MLGVSENGGLTPKIWLRSQGKGLLITEFRGLGYTILRQPNFGNKYRNVRSINRPETYLGMAGEEWLIVDVMSLCLS